MPNEVKIPSFAPLKANLQGMLFDDLFARGRYATDASIYQMMPHAVVVPKHWPMWRPRWTSPATRACRVAAWRRHIAMWTDGQPRHCDRCQQASEPYSGTGCGRRRCVVEPGIVLDELNRQLKPHGLWFPVDVSTSSRATIGGMAGNNSCGGRSIRYGMMRDNVTAIDAIMADGSKSRFTDLASTVPSGLLADLLPRLLAMGSDHAAIFLKAFPRCFAVLVATTWTR